MSLAPPETRGDTPKIVLSGRDEVLIEKHRGLFSYETKCVRVRAGIGVITVTGEGLVIAFFGADDVKIKGKINNVGLSGEAFGADDVKIKGKISGVGLSGEA